MNTVIISGNLTRDNELSFSAGKGTAISKFTVAVARGFKQEDGTDFINCVLIGKRAEGLANYLNKGTKVIVEGSLRINTYEKKDGSKGYSTEILVSNVEILSKKTNQDIESVNFGVDLQQAEDSSDIPF